MNKRIILLPLLALAGCVGRQEPAPPAPQPQVQPVARPAPPPSAATVTGWADLPLTPGTWTYVNENSTSHATYGAAGAPVFRLYCEGPTRSVFLQRYGGGAARSMNVRTSFGARNLAADAGPGFATATLPSTDRFLDNMIFSRGRFSVEVPGTAALILPSWAEAARVVEDCRRNFSADI